MRRVLWLIAAVAVLTGCSTTSRIDAEHPVVLVDRVQADAVVRDVATLLSAEAVVAVSRFDGCQTGRDGWKMNDPDFVCTVVESRVLPVAGGGDDVGQGLATVRGAMSALGCGSESRFLDESDLEFPGSTPMSFRCEASGLQLSLLALDESSGQPESADVYGPPVTREFERKPFPDDVIEQLTASEVGPAWQITVSRTYALLD